MKLGYESLNETMQHFQIVSGYFTWTDGPPTLSNVDIKIPFGKQRLLSVSFASKLFIKSVILFPAHRTSQES